MISLSSAAENAEEQEDKYKNLTLFVAPLRSAVACLAEYDDLCLDVILNSNSTSAASALPLSLDVDPLRMGFDIISQN